MILAGPAFLQACLHLLSSHPHPALSTPTTSAPPIRSCASNETLLCGRCLSHGIDSARPSLVLEASPRAALRSLRGPGFPIPHPFRCFRRYHLPKNTYARSSEMPLATTTHHTYMWARPMPGALAFALRCKTYPLPFCTLAAQGYVSRRPYHTRVAQDTHSRNRRDRREPQQGSSAAGSDQGS